MIRRYPAGLMFRTAIETRNIQLLRRLQASPLWSRIHPEMELPDGQTPLQLVTRRAEPGDSELLRLLLTHPRFDPSVEGNAALVQVIGREASEIVRLLLADPRVNPSITPQKADILRNGIGFHLEGQWLSIGFDFDAIYKQWRHDIPQLIVSVNHALDKEEIRLQAKNLTKLQVLEPHASMLPDITNTVATGFGLRKNKGTVANRLTKLKGNYYGPTRKNRRNN